jgi:hypothetical protein
VICREGESSPHGSAARGRLHIRRIPDAFDGDDTLEIVTTTQSNNWSQLSEEKDEPALVSAVGGAGSAMPFLVAAAI